MNRAVAIPRQLSVGVGNAECGVRSGNRASAIGYRLFAIGYLRSRFMASIHVRILEVFPFHEPLVRSLTFAARF